MRRRWLKQLKLSHGFQDRLLQKIDNPTQSDEKYFGSHFNFENFHQVSILFLTKKLNGFRHSKAEDKSTRMLMDQKLFSGVFSSKISICIRFPTVEDYEMWHLPGYFGKCWLTAFFPRGFRTFNYFSGYLMPKKLWKLSATFSLKFHADKGMTAKFKKPDRTVK